MEFGTFKLSLKHNSRNTIASHLHGTDLILIDSLYIKELFIERDTFQFYAYKHKIYNCISFISMIFFLPRDFSSACSHISPEASEIFKEVHSRLVII